MSQRKVYEIAKDIRSDWKKVNYAALPYLEAMESMANPSDKYFEDNGKDIISRFLSNASSWTGENAKKIKAEMKEMLK